MPKQVSGQLYHLINRLSRAEKRHFKIYSKRNASQSDALFIQLFDFLDGRKEPTDANILERIPGIKKTQLSNVKAHLYKQILTSLRLLYTNQNPEMLLREQIDFAHVLYAKGFYRESLTILDRAKTRARNLQLSSLLLDIISFEKHIESQHITRSIDTRAEDLANESVQISRRVNRETRFSNLSLRLYGLYLKNGFARSKDEVNELKQLFLDMAPTYDAEGLNFYERLFLYQSFTWLYYMTHEFSKLYRYSNKWVLLFDEFPQMLSSNIPLYLKGLHNLLFAQFLTLQYDRFLDSLEKLETFNHEGKLSLTQNEHSLWVLFKYIHRINKHYLFGTFTEGIEWIKDLEEVLRSQKYQWDYHREMVFYYRIACMYFGSGDNETAIEYLNLITNRVEVNFREDIQCFARILSLIAHFELGNDLLIRYKLKSVYRFLSKMEEMNEVHRAIFQFLRRTPQIEKSAVNPEFENLHRKLKSIEQNPFERRSFLYLDIISWLECKIEGRPVEDIIRGKYLQRIT